MTPIFNGRYAVNKEGEVFSLLNTQGNYRKEPLRMATSLNRKGYPRLTLMVETPFETKRVCVPVHTLVARSFVPNPNNLPQVNHINGNKLDNTAENLEWVTGSDNILHAYKNGLKQANLGGTGKFNELHVLSKPIQALNTDGAVILEFPSVAEAQRQGYSRQCISRVLSGKRDSYKQMIWVEALSKR